MDLLYGMSPFILMCGETVEFFTAQCVFYYNILKLFKFLFLVLKQQ